MAALILLSVAATATLSGVFGMGGGMILMGILAATVPLATAMILHGIVQLGANGFRAILLARYIRWRIFAAVAVGAVVVLAAFVWLQWRLEVDAVFLVLGAIPLVALTLPPALRLTVESPTQAVLCGSLLTGLQLVAGASGPILDAFFLRGRLNRFEIVATKASIGALGHILKLLYWGIFLRSAEAADIPWWLGVLCVLAALTGTRLGKSLLARLREHSFRRYSRLLIIAIASVYLARGLW